MPSFVLTEQTEKLIAYLKMFDKGSRLSYRELSDAIGVPIKACDSHLASARKILQRDHHAVWIAVRPKVGIVRLNDAEIAERQDVWWMRTARSKLRRGGNQADAVDLGQLDTQQQVRFSVDCIQRDLAMQSLSKANRAKIEKVARGSSNDLPAFTAVEWAISLTRPAAKESVA